MKTAVYHLFPDFRLKFILKATSKFETNSITVRHQSGDLVLDYSLYTHDFSDKGGIRF